jgi:cell division protein FtsZ
MARIKVIGVGGAGGNAVNNMIDAGLEGLVEFIACNTDSQDLDRNRAETKIQLGAALTEGLGAGGNPEKGRKAILEDMSQIGEHIQGAHMVFIACGLGGGTGTGAAPVIAAQARELGILTVAVATTPFGFEGPRRMRRAEEGLDALTSEVDSLIRIPNEKLLEVVGQNITALDAYRFADRVLLDAVQGITDLIQLTGHINVDFADVETTMHEAGPALMGTGWGEGDERAVQAARAAISSPLLEDVGVAGATKVLLNITGSENLTLFELNAAADVIREAAADDVDLIFGHVIDPTVGDRVKVTVIATCFESRAAATTDVEARARVEIPKRRSSQMPLPYRAATERPAVNRALGRRSEVPAEPVPVRVGSVIYNEAEIDIPTFIRKQTDNT